MDSAAVQAAAEVAASELRSEGLSDVRIEALPADGVTSCGGWIMPVAWFVRDARLEMVGLGHPAQVLADYSEVPQSLALYSPGTPGGRWVEGTVVAARSPAEVRRRLRGRFLFLTEGMGSFEMNEAAAEAGALGIIVCVAGPDSHASRYLNYAVPLDAQRRCIPCFSLAPDAGERLKAALQTTPGLRLRARVRSRRRAGTQPMVTATVGQGTPAVYLCAHLDEPGAQDNASGTAVAIEAMRTLQALTEARGFRPAARGVRILLSTEVRGLQAWLNRGVRVPPFLAGLNVDMAGGPATDGAPAVVLRGGFRDRGHFARYLLSDAGRIADSVVPGIASKAGHNYVSDAILTPRSPPGHVSMEQGVGPTYHTSGDVPDRLSLRTLHWSGVASVAYLYAATRLAPIDGMSLARRIIREGKRDLARQPGREGIIGRRMSDELASVRGIMQSRPNHHDWPDPESWYRAGVSRRTGCWPAVEQGLRLQRLIADTRVTVPRARSGASSARREALRLVPQALFNGFLSFEDQFGSGRAAALERETGLRPRWGTDNWAWMLARHMRGKQTLAALVDDLSERGVEVDMSAAVRLTQRLAHDGKVRLRPVIEAAEFSSHLRALGVKAGRVLFVHSSLSACGYIAGGPATIVDVLLRILGPRGTLVMPTHTVSLLGNPPYDRLRSPSGVGAVTEYFRKLAGVVRSPHPTHSVAACGPLAGELTEAHAPGMSPLAREGFWGQFYDRDGDVLLLCPIRSATVFHAGEDWTKVPQPSAAVHAIEADGRRRVYTLHQMPWHVDHFERSLAAPLLHRGLIRRLSLGEGPTWLGRARDMADISVRVNRANPCVSLGRGGACACFYCEALRRGVAARQGSTA